MKDKQINRLKQFMHDLKWRLMKPYWESFMEPNSKVLDVGTGDLYLSKKVKKEFKCDVTGADIYDYKTKFVKFVKIDGKKLPFKRNSFDYVMFSDTLHHMHKYEQQCLLEEARRVAKKGILIWEDDKNLTSYFLEIITNRLSMQKEFTHKDNMTWKWFFWGLGFKSQIYNIHKPFWYPLKHYFMFLDIVDIWDNNIKEFEDVDRVR